MNNILIVAIYDSGYELGAMIDNVVDEKLSDKLWFIYKHYPTSYFNNYLKEHYPNYTIYIIDNSYIELFQKGKEVAR